jgi:hypothetical protein
VKNFPNQLNDPEKFRAWLDGIEGLRAAGDDPSDDGVLGAEAARRGIYRLGGAGSLRARLAAERRKPPSNQGTRTTAREMRRTLVELGFLDDALQRTRTGKALMASSPGSEQEKSIWREALLSLSLADDDGNVSHPILILLRLIGERAIYYRDGMELALEAKDDSHSEFRRMLRMIDLSADDRRTALGISKTQQDNARKIFPALAEFSGLIERQSRQHPYTLTELGKLAVGASLEVSGPPPPLRRIRRRRRPFKRAAGALARGTAARRRRRARGRRREMTSEEQAAAEQLLHERTDRHEDLVDCVISTLPSSYPWGEDPRSFDLLADPGSTRNLLLFEMKTLDEVDEATQTRRAIGQLLFYEGTVVADGWPGRRVDRVVVFEAAVSDYLRDLLQRLGIAAVWCDAEGLHALNSGGRRLVRQLTSE